MRFVFLVSLFVVGVVVALAQFDPPKLAASRGLELTFAPVWEGGINTSTNRFLSSAVRVDVRNAGRGVRAVLAIETDGGVIRTPVELPGGAEKSVVFYPPSAGFGEMNLSLTWQEGRIALPLPYEPYGDQAWASALISDTPGALNGASMQEARATGRERRPIVGTGTPRRFLSAKPGQAPVRTAGYRGLHMVVLGRGSERLSDAEVQALLGFVLTGGTLIVPGGASAPILNDSRWESAMPVTGGRADSVQRVAWLNRFGNSAPQNLAVQRAQALPGVWSVSQDGLIVRAVRRYGLGRVEFWAFNPTEGELREWDGLPGLFESIPSHLMASQSLLNQSGVSRGNPVNYSRYMGADEFGPFSTKLPEPALVGGILVAYLIVVVPISFLVLRALRRGELAWLTAPLVSLAFAAIFFMTARELYEAQMSRSTAGVLFADNASRKGYFSGHQQLFIPRQGQYDLGWQGVEVIDGDNNDLFGRPNRARWDVEDFGSIEDSDFSVSNLSFREVYLTQQSANPFRARGNLTLSRRGESPEYKADFVYEGPTVLKNARLFDGSFMANLGDLKPGQRVKARGVFAQARQQMTDSGNAQRVALVGNFSADEAGLRLGSNLGKEVSVRGVMLVMSLDFARESRATP